MSADAIGAAWVMISEAIKETLNIEVEYVKETIHIMKTGDTYIIFDDYVGNIFSSKDFDKAFYVFRGLVIAKQCGF